MTTKKEWKLTLCNSIFKSCVSLILLQDLLTVCASEVISITWCPVEYNKIEKQVQLNNNSVLVAVYLIIITGFIYLKLIRRMSTVTTFSSPLFVALECVLNS